MTFTGIRQWHFKHCFGRKDLRGKPTIKGDVIIYSEQQGKKPRIMEDL